MVWVTEDEIRAIAEHEGTTYGEILIHRTRLVGTRRSLKEYPNGDCTYFDPQARRCTIYSVRPAQCRTWPFWPSHLESPETWQRVQSFCPGVGRGAFVPLAEIERQAAMIDP